MSEKYVSQFKLDLKTISQEILEASSNQNLRQITLTLPKTNGIASISDLLDFLNTQSLLDIGFNIQILPNSSILVTLFYNIDQDSEDSEETLIFLDKLTSAVISNGGTISSK